MEAATRSDLGAGRWPTTWEPLGPNVCTVSIVVASPPPKRRALGPEITDAVSWVATDSVPAAETVPLAGSKRRTLADDLPPTRPPRISRVAPSGTAWALDIGVGSPLPTGVILRGGGEPRVVGTAAAGAGAVWDGTGVAPAEGAGGETAPWPPRPSSRGMPKMASTARTTTAAIVRVSPRRRRR